MRNLKKEAEWEKNKYKRYQYKCNKETAKEFDNKLLTENISFSTWLRQRIKEYLGG